MLNFTYMSALHPYKEWYLKKLNNRTILYIQLHILEIEIIQWLSSVYVVHTYFSFFFIDYTVDFPV